jgi:hypothetical protein
MSARERSPVLSRGPALKKLHANVVIKAHANHPYVALVVGMKQQSNARLDEVFLCTTEQELVSTMPKGNLFGLQPNTLRAGNFPAFVASQVKATRVGAVATFVPQSETRLR